MVNLDPKSFGRAMAEAFAKQAAPVEPDAVATVPRDVAEASARSPAKITTGIKRTPPYRAVMDIEQGDKRILIPLTLASLNQHINDLVALQGELEELEEAAAGATQLYLPGTPTT